MRLQSNLRIIERSCREPRTGNMLRAGQRQLCQRNLILEQPENLFGVIHALRDSHSGPRDLRTPQNQTVHPLCRIDSSISLQFLPGCTEVTT